MNEIYAARTTAGEKFVVMLTGREILYEIHLDGIEHFAHGANVPPIKVRVDTRKDTAFVTNFCTQRGFMPISNSNTSGAAIMNYILKRYDIDNAAKETLKNNLNPGWRI